MAWRPADGWSIGQIFEHLRLANETYLARIRVAVRAASRGAGKPEAGVPGSGVGSGSRQGAGAEDAAGRPWRPTLLGRALIRMSGPSDGSRLWAPPSFRPSPDPPPGAPEAYRRQLAELARLLLESRGLDLTGTRVAYPFWPRLHLNLGDAFEIVIGHAERHTAQAGRVLARAERPRRVGR